MNTVIVGTGEDTADRHDPVLRLPPELVTAVYLLLDFWDRVAVSHVTRSWRALALSDALLWNKVDLTPPALPPPPPLRPAHVASRNGGVRARFAKVYRLVFRPPSPPSPARRRADMLHALLIRSHPLPFTLTWPGSHVSAVPPEVVTVIVENLFRMQALSLPLEAADFRRLSEMRAPILRSLQCTLYNASYEFPVRWDAPRLETLALPCVRIPAHVQPVPSVQSFSCEALLDVGLAETQLFSIFPSLRSFKLAFLMRDTLPALSNPPASLARLHLHASYGVISDYGPLFRACAGHHVRTMYVEAAASCADALELFTSVVPGAWRLDLADPWAREVHLTATNNDAAYAIHCAQTVSLAREPRIALQLARLASLTAPAQLIVDLEALEGWSRSLPAMRDLTIHFGDREQMDALAPVHQRRPIRVPLLEAVTFCLTAETEGCEPWVMDVFPGFLRSRFSLPRPRLARIVLETPQQRVPEVAELAALRALTQYLRVDLRSHRKVLEYRDEAV